MDKRDRAALFRERLASAMAAAGMTKSGLARLAAVDRSTVSLLLSKGEVRLPNAHLAAECAAALGVSADWLLGLSDRPETSADILSTVMQVADAERSPADERIYRWHEEARSYKIRHVPATLPDILKSEEVLAFEYEAAIQKTSAQAIADMRRQLAYLQAPDTDYEIAMPADFLHSFAAGEGYWQGLDVAVRRAQLKRLAELTRDLYPSLRLYLFDRKRLFSAPVTIFGPLLAALYVGRFYLVFRERRQVQLLTQHFDGLVRDADFEARYMAAHVEKLAEALE